MKRLVLLAPGVFPPLTEGRKRFVIDLNDHFSVMGFAPSLIRGADNRHGGWSLIQTLGQLLVQLVRDKPDVVLIFPYGRFSGLRGFANLLFVLTSRCMAWMAGVRSGTVLYSVDGRSLSSLGSYCGKLAAVGCQLPGVRFVHLGLGERMPVRRIEPSSMPRLLFLCGYQHADSESLKGVLQERGLELLLRAMSLIRKPVSLTVAIPFLRSNWARSELTSLAEQICPSVAITWVAEGDPHELLASHDAFVFPYAVSHEVFIPTSMLEAMAIGTPVIATDLMMYRSLCNDGNECGCFLAKGVTVEALHAAIEECLSTPLDAITKAEVQRIKVLKNWTISRASKDILAFCDELKV